MPATEPSSGPDRLQQPAAGLAERGQALWDALTTNRKWDPAGAVLVAEACRMADRLERLDELLRHEVGAWAQITEDFDNGRREIHLEIDDALGEARQLQGSLLTVLTKLGLGKSTESAAAGGDALDELARQRSARIAAASAG